MIAVLGPRMLEQPWLLVSLATYAIAAVIAFAIQRPALRKLQPATGSRPTPIAPGGGTAPAASATSPTGSARPSA